MQEEAPLAPEMGGLPEYRVSEWLIETDGSDIRVACGTKRFGHVEWLYTAVMKPEKLKLLLQECNRITDTSHAISQLMDRFRSH